MDKLPRDKNGFRITAPPFEIYDGVHIADSAGHLCTCDTPALAIAVRDVLRQAAGDICPACQAIDPCECGERGFYEAK